MKRRQWSRKLKGYTYDGVTLTKCQCNLSAGPCKCGNYQTELEERKRANHN
jgi:hypothetical protein